METILSVTGLLLVGAITPGPNNLVVLHTAARRGFKGVLVTMAGILSGSCVLLALMVYGFDALFESAPGLRLALMAAGCIYLVWLGIRLIVHPDGRDVTGTNSGKTLPEGFAGLFVFQFLNPKAWILLVTVVSAMPTSSRAATYIQIVAMFFPISVACLSLWAALGRLFATIRNGRIGASLFERSMGCLLIGSAALLLIDK